MRKILRSNFSNHVLNYLWIDTLGNQKLDQPISVWKSCAFATQLQKALDNIYLDPETKLVIQSVRSRKPKHPHVWPWSWVFLFLILPSALVSVLNVRIVTLIWALICGGVGCYHLLIVLSASQPYLGGSWNTLIVPFSHIVIAFITLSGSLWSQFSILIKYYFSTHAIVLLGVWFFVTHDNLSAATIVSVCMSMLIAMNITGNGHGPSNFLGGAIQRRSRPRAISSIERDSGFKQYLN